MASGRVNFERYHLPVPPLDEQRTIARILGSLDDKIAEIRRMNRTQEELATTIFKSWFGGLDPVAARAEGRQPFGMDVADRALFPACRGVGGGAGAGRVAGGDDWRGVRFS